MEEAGRKVWVTIDYGYGSVQCLAELRGEWLWLPKIRPAAIGHPIPPEDELPQTVYAVKHQ